MAVTVLIAEDDRHLAGLLKEIMLGDGYQVLLVNDGVEAVQAAKRERIELVLLAIRLPRKDGWGVIREIRHFSDVPIIIVTDMISEADKVRGLELGADDYITKPFSAVELRARVRAALRRVGHGPLANQVIPLDDRLVLDRRRCAILVDGQLVRLSATEYKLLALFVENRGRVLTHYTLLSQVWGWEFTEHTHYLKVYVHHLRRKIEPKHGDPQYILCERGLGYRFVIPPSP